MRTVKCWSCREQVTPEEQREVNKRWQFRMDGFCIHCAEEWEESIERD